MNPRHAAALALVLVLMGCGTHAKVIDKATKRSQAAAEHAVIAANRADQAAKLASKEAARAAKSEANCKQSLRKAHDSVMSLEAGLRVGPIGPPVLVYPPSARTKPALALVGWYLLIPPWAVMGSEMRPIPDPDALLSKWVNEGNFDSAGVCDHALSQFLNAAQRKPLPDRSRANFAQCVATDDPRLKEK